MLTCLVCLTGLLTANDPVPQPPGEEVYEKAAPATVASADPILPTPPATAKGDSSGLYYLGGVSGPGDCSVLGGGWQFRDDSTLEVRWLRRVSLAEATYRRSVWETETRRCSLITGSRVGVCGEYYLGRGFAAGLELGASLRRDNSPLMAEMRLDYYPREGVQVSFGWDLARGRWECDWKIAR